MRSTSSDLVIHLYIIFILYTCSLLCNHKLRDVRSHKYHFHLMISQHDFELCRMCFQVDEERSHFQHIGGESLGQNHWADLAMSMIGENHPHIAWTLSLFQVLDSNSSVMQFADFSDREGSDALDTITLTQF